MSKLLFLILMKNTILLLFLILNIFGLKAQERINLDSLEAERQAAYRAKIQLQNEQRLLNFVKQNVIKEVTLYTGGRVATRVIPNKLKELRDLGNTVIVVEHEDKVMKASDQIIDIGFDQERHRAFDRVLELDGSHLRNTVRDGGPKGHPQPLPVVALQVLHGLLGDDDPVTNYSH